MSAPCIAALSKNSTPAQHAQELGINIIDAGHFGTELPIVETLAQYLQEENIKKNGK